MALDSHYPPEGIIVEWFPAVGDLAFLWIIVATIGIIGVNRKVRALARRVDQLRHAESNVCPSCGSLAGRGRFCGSCGCCLEQSVATK
jgi:ribosomal protein L32